MIKSKHLTRFCAAALLVCAFGVTPAFAQEADAAFKKQLEAYLKTNDGQKMVGTAVQEYFKRLQQGPSLDEMFENPIKVDPGSSPTKGKSDARVTIIEFSDFECPYCSRGTANVKKVLEMYPNDVKLVFKNLPLQFHKNADPAARAALAAAEQGKFWEMHDELFANQRSLSDEFIVKTAEKLGLDMDKFKKDRDSDAIKKQVAEDMALAQKVGIRGTPGFLINGVKISGAQPVDKFKEIIDRWIKELDA